MGDLKGALPRTVLRLNWPLAEIHLTGLSGAVGRWDHLESSDWSFGGESKQSTWDLRHSVLETGLAQMAHLAMGTLGPVWEWLSQPGLPSSATRRESLQLSPHPTAASAFLPQAPSTPTPGMESSAPLPGSRAEAGERPV